MGRDLRRTGTVIHLRQDAKQIRETASVGSGIGVITAADFARLRAVAKWIDTCADLVDGGRSGFPALTIAGSET